MAADNLLLVHGRIGTLDIYARRRDDLGGACYLRGRPVPRRDRGSATCCKLVAPYVLLVLALFELAARRGRRAARPTTARPARRLGVLVARAPACSSACSRYWIGSRRHTTRAPRDGSSPAALRHIAHMVSYAAQPGRARTAPSGIASYPWEWLVDLKPIIYLNIDPARPSPGTARHSSRPRTSSA